MENLKVEISFATPLRLVVSEQEDETPYRAIWTVQTGGLTFTGENMGNTMQIGTYATASVEWKDNHGNPAKVDGPTKWESSDPNIVTCTVSTGNPLIANLYAPGPIGKVQIHATADADMGEGVKAVTSSLDVEAISGEAVGGEMKFSQSPAQGQPPAARPGTSRR